MLYPRLAEWEDILWFGRRFPFVHLQYTLDVGGEAEGFDGKLTAGDLITLNVTMTRMSLEEMRGTAAAPDEGVDEAGGAQEVVSGAGAPLSLASAGPAKGGKKKGGKKGGRGGRAAAAQAAAQAAARLAQPTTAGALVPLGRDAAAAPAEGPSAAAQAETDAMEGTLSCSDTTHPRH